MTENDESLLGGSVEKLLAELPQRVSQSLQVWAERTPSAPAVRDHLGRHLTYGAMLDEVTRAAATLRDRGVQPRDRVLLVNENSVPLLVAILALAEIGAWPVVVNARMTAKEIERIRSHCEPRLVLYLLDSKAAQGHWRTYQGNTDAVEVQLAGGPVGVRRLAVSGQIDVEGEAWDDVFTLIYTTGTTGAPKGVMLSHRNILYVAAVSGALRGLRNDDRVYLVLPVSHIFGLSAVFIASLMAGAELIVVDRFDPESMVKELRERSVTGILGVPTMYARLAEYLRKEGATKLPVTMPALRFMYVGGAPLDPAVREIAEETLGLPLLNGYGMTETSPTIAQVRYNEPLAHTGVGRPLPGLEVRITDANGKVVAQGDIGELHVRGPSVMSGYFRNPDATAEVLSADGFLNTGDLVWQDTDGSLHISGRSKELIIHSGFNVYPPEVEAAIVRHPEVLLCAVVGEQDQGNENVVAWVQRVSGSSLDEETLREFVRPLLAPYKRPHKILFTDELPTAPSGKVLKHLLKDPC